MSTATDTITVAVERTDLALRRLRMERGMSVAELAAQLGMNQGTVSRMENGKRTPPPSSVLARLFGVTQAEVLAPVRTAATARRSATAACAAGARRRCQACRPARGASDDLSAVG